MQVIKRRTITDKMKLAVLDRWATVTCAVCRLGNCLLDVQFDHHLALVDGGTHSVDNIRPVCVECHKIKSAREHKANAKCKRIAAGGRKRRGRKMQSRPFPKRMEART